MLPFRLPFSFLRPSVVTGADGSGSGHDPAAAAEGEEAEGGDESAPVPAAVLAASELFR